MDTMDPFSRLGGICLVWADFPNNCKVTSGLGGIPPWNVFGGDLAESVFTLAAEYLLPYDTVVVTCRGEHVSVVTFEA